MNSLDDWIRLWNVSRADSREKCHKFNIRLHNGLLHTQERKHSLNHFNWVGLRPKRSRSREGKNVGFDCDFQIVQKSHAVSALKSLQVNMKEASRFKVKLFNDIDSE